MVKVNKKELREEIKTYLIEIKIKQEELSETDEVIYSVLGLHLAAKNKVFLKNLLLHPIVLITNSFFKKRQELKQEELENLLLDVLNYEFMESELLLRDERSQVIKIHKSLKSKREKNEHNKIQAPTNTTTNVGITK